MKFNMTILFLMTTLVTGFSQQITTSESQPLNLRSDANNVTLFVGLSPTVANGGGGNTLVGYQAGQVTTSSTQNTFIGHQAGLSSSGIGNTFLGYNAGRSNQSGNFNVFVGLLAGTNNTTGLGNLFLGQQAGVANTAGSYNLFMGNSSGSATTTGIGNTAIGDGSLLRNVTGVRNAAIGQYAGIESRGNENVFIGFAADVAPATPNLTNVVAIGSRAQVSRSNSIILGSDANVGIGTSAPQNKLEITQGTAGNSGLRFTNLTSGTTATILNQTKFLTVNAQGDVILGSVNGSGRLAAVDVGGFWRVEGENVQNTNAGGVIIGADVSRTPVGYKLYVADGILTEKVKVAVKNTSDWSDRVFEPGYRLRELQEVERYVKANHHLPGVPSAKKVVVEGIDIAKMDANLLEKIEELTLYTIQLEKVNCKQQEEIREIKKLVNQLLSRK